MQPNQTEWHLESNRSTGGLNIFTRCCNNDDDDVNNSPLKKRQRTTERAEAEIARELGNLSVRERETLYEELHGISGRLSKQETEDFVEAKIKALKAALSLVPNARKHEWERASFYNPALANNVSFLVLFLRCERYDPEAAAQRLCTHFRHKAELWGSERLPKRISLEDFSEADMRCLRGGSIHFLPYSDSAGRRLLIFRCKITADSYENYSRVFWYIYMSWCLDHPEEHGTGHVGIAYTSGANLDDATHTFSILQKSLVYNEALPINTNGNHVMMDPLLRGPIESLVYLFNREIKMRLRFHTGSTIEMGYSLMTFGIQLDPRTLTNETSVREEMLDKYIEQQKHRENELKEEAKLLQSQKRRVLHPSDQDVLIGKGSFCYDYPGNRLMRSKVEAFLVQYQEGGDRLWKQALCMNVVDFMEEGGARFLERRDDCWVVVDKQKAVKKISQVFRELIRKSARSQG